MSAARSLRRAPGACFEFLGKATKPTSQSRAPAACGFSSGALQRRGENRASLRATQPPSFPGTFNHCSPVGPAGRQVFPGVAAPSRVQTRRYAKGKKGRHGADKDEGLEEFDQDRFAERMDAIANSLRIEYANVRVGAATPAILDPVKVNIEHREAKLTDVSQVIIKDASTLLVQPYDSSYAGPIEKAIRNANLGLNPVAESRGLRVPIPKISAEGRQALVKKVKDMQMASAKKIRDIRKEADEDVKNLSSTWSKNEIYQLKKDLENMTKKALDELDALAQKKTLDINKC